ncbi:MAG: DedA family protein [Gammaproteobacteria bacterium]|nr:DedA family protein [Gammaproteobacteria bacterium]
MELMSQFIDLLLHLDKHLLDLTTHYGMWVYGILFLIVFCETGLVVTPFLPGDSLLFVTGTLAGAGLLNPGLLCGVLITAAVLGDSLNYFIGRKFGPAVFKRPDARFFKLAHLHRTQRFYEKHGGKTIIIARFIPVVRTFAPFVAGIGNMRYARFIAYNIIGGIAWVVVFVSAGIYFGNLPWVKNNLTLVILGIIILSIMPGLVEYLRHRLQSAKIRG